MSFSREYHISHANKNWQNCVCTVVWHAVVKIIVFEINKPYFISNLIFLPRYLNFDSLLNHVFHSFIKLTFIFPFWTNCIILKLINFTISVHCREANILSTLNIQKKYNFKKKVSIFLSTANLSFQLSKGYFTYRPQILFNFR